MKKILTAVAMALLLVGCAKEAVDLSGINEKLAELENRVSALEGSIASIQSAVGDGVFVQKVEQYADPETGKTVGVTVTYTSGKVVYFEISPKAGYAGPVLGVITSGSGQLVWAVDGVAIKDANGHEVPVNKTPVFTIDGDGNLLVSIDGGDPVVVGQVQNEGATLVDGIFTDLAVEQDKVVLTLSDGTKVNIPFATAFKLNIEQKEYVVDDNNTITIPYTVSGKTANTVVGVAGYDPYYFYVEVTEENIQIKPLNSVAEAVFLIYADSQVGLTSIVSVSVARAAANILDPTPEGVLADYVAEAEGGNVDMHVVSNVDIDVVSEEPWITIVETKSKVYTITAKLEENKSMEERSGYVFIYKKGTEQRLQSIEILQKFSSVDNAKDLSKTESANSYMVTAAGEYKFKAVKGNSAISVGEVEKVEILWETENTATAPEVNAIIAKARYASGYVRFETPATLVPGNALIAAKDANDVILWSWHIWIPADKVAIWDSEDFAGAKMMDRNLGALKATGATGDVDPLSIGLYYQWGRKDPFPGAVEFAKSPKGAAVAGIAWTSHPELVTTEYSVQHPTEYAHIPDVDDGVWNSADPKDLWNAEGDQKTIYDPCPPGYRVPIYDSSKPMWSGSWDGFSAEGNRVSYGDFHFTIAGYIDCWTPSYAYSNLRTHIWAGKWYDEKRGTAMYIRADKDGGEKYYSQKFHKAKAGSVRCVVDANAPVQDNTIDLSEKGTANSYIVSEAGDYKFKAVKGNSDESVGAVATATILWETWNSAEEVTVNSVIAKADVKDGYITFSTPETLKPGNAVIAAKDANDVILWSWHIWIPATQIATDTYGIYNAKMMDRNLGALKAASADAVAGADTYGFFYQWGRKDPFPGPADAKSSSFAKTSGAAPSQLEGDGGTDACKITLEQSIQNPLLMGRANSADWIIPSDNTLWADEAKTIYDPCPVGYRVPARVSDQPIHSGDYTAVTGWKEDEPNCLFTLGDPLAVFPLAGYLDDYGPADGVTKNGLRTIYWTAHNGSDKAAYCMSVRSASAGNVHKLDQAGKARGGYVRCVAE